MSRFLVVVLLVAALVGSASTPASVLNSQGKAPWATVKGRIFWDVKIAPVPPRLPINIGGNNPPCLLGAKLLDESLLVNPKNHGIANVLLWLEPMGGNLPIHPNLKAIKNKQVEIDQPCLSFIPRILALRQGQELVVKNNATFAHNFRWTGDPDINPGGNQSISPGGKYVINNLKAQRMPLGVECNIHSWMRGRIAVFDHPYFTISDEDGKFEIPLAPEGNYKLMILHEHGWLGGKLGREGRSIQIQGGELLDLGDLAFNVKK